MSYAAFAKERGLAPATVQFDLAVLRHAFNQARDAGKVGIVPKFPALKFDNTRRGFWTTADYRAVLAELPDYLRPALVIGFHCGWRVKSELLTRKVKHADLKAGTLMLEPGETKNRKPRIWVFKRLPEVEAAITALVQNGAAEGEAVVTSRLFERAKKGEAWAVCFYLKARCGWRDTPDPAGVNVNNIGVGGPADEEGQAALDRQRKLFKLMTPDEMRLYRGLLQRLAIRQKQQQEAAANRGAIETTTTAEPVQSNSNGGGPEGAG